MSKKKPAPVKVDPASRSLARRKPMRTVDVPMLTSRKYRELYFKNRGDREVAY
jgi:hypothetical protein|tara:strand:- start:1582 stop:1740 length:159 start_codon:yes stop_codon:yes gene_type:complete